MKKQIFAVLLMLSYATLALAQREQTLAGSVHNKGGFGGFYMLFSEAGGQPGGGGGFNGAFIANDLFFGGYLQLEFYGQRPGSYRNYDLGLGTTGFWLGYAYPSYKSIHLFTSAKLGWGAAVLTRRDNDPFNNNDINDGIVAFAPEIGAEANLTHWLRLTGTVGYRWTSGVTQLPGLNNGDFRHAFVSFGLRAGGFGYAKSK